MAASPEFPAWLVDTAIVWPLILFPITAVWWLLRREVHRMRLDLINEVKSSTQQIQPGYRNDGGSLRDIADAVQAIDSRLDAHVTDRTAHT